MVGGAPLGVKGTLVAISILAVACSGAAARREARTHTDVLESIAQKGVDLVRTGRLVAESMPELTYPLERAKAFAEREVVRRGEPLPASLVAFQDLVARYRDFVDALDQIRRERGGTEARDALAPSLEAVEAAARAVRAALAQERSSG
jgi:hypothetical protein